MKLIKFFTALVLLIGTGSVIAKANVIEDRHLSGFSAVIVSGSFDVFITQGAVESVKVDAPGNVIHNIITDVRGGTLNIYTKDHFTWSSIFGSSKKLAIYVTVKNITGIDLTGSGDVYFKEGLSANLFHLRLTGSGDVVGKLNVHSLESSITGSGDIKLSGHADNLKVSVTGSGDFAARNLSATNAVAQVGGSGDADINVNGSLQANVTGSGDITYSGNPKNISKSTSGSGEISRR